jgi:transposase-like protein
MVRNSLKYVSWRDYNAVSTDLKRIYQAPTEEAAARELEAFSQCWDGQYRQISKSWTTHWPHLITLFEYPPEIRRVIYTTNAIESLNSVIRKATRQRKIFPSDDSAMKVVFLAMNEASRKWTMPIRNWKPALNRFMLDFGDRLAEHQ